MTLQTYDELHDDAERLHPDVIEEMSEWDSDTPWWVEYEIPPETNGWIYYGNPGALSNTHYWVNDVEDPSEGVTIHHTPTHPQDDSRDVLRVHHKDELGDSTYRGELLFEIEGESYRTPIHVKRRMFWEGVEAAIEWMEANAP